MPSKSLAYKGKVCKILEEKEASRSNDPKVKKAYLTTEFGWVVDQDCDSAKELADYGQDNSQTS